MRKSDKDTPRLYNTIRVYSGKGTGYSVYWGDRMHYIDILYVCRSIQTI